MIWRLLAHPDWAAPLALLALTVALALGLAHVRARRRARRLLGPAGGHGARGRGADALLFLALVLVLAALAGPRLGSRTRLVPGTGADVVVLLDVSASMDARDVPPSRMVRARDVARRVLGALAPGDRAALAAYASRGVLLTPLTPDTGALVAMLPALDASLMRRRGSRLDEGLRAALGAFEPSRARPRVVLVLGDGEDPADAGVPLAEVVRSGVRVVAVALGSEAGSRIRVGERTVLTRRVLTDFERLARASDGAVVATDRLGGVDVPALVATLRRDASRAPGEPVERREAVVGTAPFALAAFALLALESLLPRRRRAAVLAATALLVAGTGARELDGRALLALGLERADTGDADGAARAFFAAAARSRDPGLAALAYYDLGVVELGRGRLESARVAFFDALALEPRDRRTQFNLEWTLRALASRPPPAGAEAQPDAGTEPEEPDGTSEHEEPEPRPAPRPAPLGADEVRRWLEQVHDDPGPALRDAARRAEAGERPPARDEPRW